MADALNINTESAKMGTSPIGEKLASGQIFDIFVTLDNHSNTPYQMPTINITELVIEEDILHWPFKGYLTYSNPNEVNERTLNDDAWFYRMDARDEIRIQVKLGKDIKSDDFIPEVWEIDLDFVIYDTIDIPAANVATKAKRIYFWDKRYQMMMDKKVYWSTVTAQGLQGAAHLTDEERSMLTGDAIKHLLEETSGYTDSVDTENWDVGNNNLFYTSPCNNSISNDLDVLLKYHTSEKHNDVCIFRYNNRIDKKWQLIPLHKFFDNAGNKIDNPGPWQLETYKFEDIESSDIGDTTPYRSPYNDPIKGLNFEVDINIPEWQKITTYDFTDMSGIDNTKALVSKPVYSFSFNNNQFDMDYKDNEIEKVKSEFKTLYTDKLLPKEKAFPNFTLNDTKKDQYNIDPQFIWSKTGGFSSKESRLQFGRNKILFGGFIFNEFIKFRVLGSPHRTSGKWVGIKRETSDDKMKFDNKVCGQWFVTNVKHIWNQNRYVNDIEAVKVHMHSDPGIVEGIE